MSMSGGCDCNNITVVWHTREYSHTPRACQCDYCSAKSAAYVTESGTKVEVTISNDTFHKTIQHGSNSASFHECTNCNQLVFVTAKIDGQLYGALNANLLINKQGFSAISKLTFSSQTAKQKRDRWRQNWCRPVLITRQGMGPRLRRGAML